MKNQYFGDVNDYLKYGFLRGLLANTDLSLGVCWLLTEDDRGRDGELRQYLRDPDRWRHYDPALFDALSRLLSISTPRTVRHADNWNLLPGARYHAQVLGDRAAEREAYFQAAETSLGMCDLWFFDPDNGLEVRSAPYGRRRSAKFLYWREVQRVYAAGKSLVIYQHYPREPRSTFIERIRADLKDRTGAHVVLAVRTPRVGFFVVCQPGHAERLQGACVAVLRRWRPRLLLHEGT